MLGLAQSTHTVQAGWKGFQGPGNPVGVKEAGGRSCSKKKGVAL